MLPRQTRVGMSSRVTVGHAMSAEQVRAGHPDKVCDQIADNILDAFIEGAKSLGLPASGAEQQRAAIEVLAKDTTVVLAGEVRVDVDVAKGITYAEIVESVLSSVGYDASRLRIIDLLGIQQPELQASSDRRGAGDQGVMVGYATRESPSGMPIEHVYASGICQALDLHMRLPGFEWMRPDGKAQVTVNSAGRLQKIVVGVQHASDVGGTTLPSRIQKTIREQVVEEILLPLLGPDVRTADIVVNGSGSFAIGGPAGDAGVVGRKIVCDSYGPRVPVGGGAFSGKDPTKVDRTGAYMARMIAKAALRESEESQAVTARIAYAIGSRDPEMLVVTDESGRDLSSWAARHFPDLAPAAIQERLDLWRHRSTAWSYGDCARYGHFGRPGLPWEEQADED